MLLQWLIFIHVLSAITFFLGHGAAAAMTFKIREERDFTRLRAMLDLSQSTFPLYMLSFSILVLSGVGMAFLVQLWGKGWVWLSIILMIVVSGYMAAFNEKSYKELRRLVGLPYMRGNKDFPAEPPSSPEEVDALIKRMKPVQMAAVGWGVPAVILWLMIFKPF